MAVTLVAKLKRPFLSMRRRRSVRHCSTVSDQTSNQLQVTRTEDVPHSMTPTPPLETRARREDRLLISNPSEDRLPLQVSETARPSEELRVECKRRRSDEFASRRRRRSAEGKGRLSREASLEKLFREVESERSCRLFCTSPLLRKVSSLFRKKRSDPVPGMNVRASCMPGMEWSTNLQNYRPSGYKIFARRKGFIANQKVVPPVEASVSSNSGGAVSKKSPKNPKNTTERIQLSAASPVSPPLPTIKDLSVYGLEDLYLYEGPLADSASGVYATSLIPTSSKEDALCSSNFHYENDSALGLDSDAYTRNSDELYATPAVNFYLRPRRYVLQPSRFQREHLAKLSQIVTIEERRRDLHAS